MNRYYCGENRAKTEENGHCGIGRKKKLSHQQRQKKKCCRPLEKKGKRPDENEKGQKTGGGNKVEPVKSPSPSCRGKQKAAGLENSHPSPGPVQGPGK